MEKQTQVTQRVSTEVCVMQELGSGTPYSGEMSYIIFLHYTVDFHWRLSQRIYLSLKTYNNGFQSTCS